MCKLKFISTWLLARCWGEILWISKSQWIRLNGYRTTKVETWFTVSTPVINHPLQQTGGCSHYKLVSYLHLSLHHVAISQPMFNPTNHRGSWTGRSRECEARYISERKLPSKRVWLHLQTSAAHRALHCSPSVGLGSQAALTALLLPASLTDVPETHSFTVDSPLQSVCQPTSDHRGKECSSVRGRWWLLLCRKWLGWASYLHHSVAVAHSGY